MLCSIDSTRQKPTGLHDRCLQGSYIDGLLNGSGNVDKKDILQHVNSVDNPIKSTVGDIWPDGSMPFLETIMLEQNRTLSLGVYLKPIYTNQYLEWDSHHHIADKCSVITLTPELQTGNA